MTQMTNSRRCTFSRRAPYNVLCVLERRQGVMRDVVIVSGARTAIGKSPRGSLRNSRPDDLAAVAIAAAVERAGIEAGDIEDVILGCAQPELEQGLNIARVAALRAGLPMS